MKIMLDEGAFAPVRAHLSDAGLDLRTPIEFDIPKGGNAVIDIGVHFELPKGTYGRIAGRSGLNVKHNIICPDGIVDEDFRGSVVVKLYNLGEENYHFDRGDKIAQMIIEKCCQPEMEVTTELTDTERGASGFGSTGK